MLIKNLKRLVARIEEGITPLKIVEVWIFGSFLRMKPDPGDLDLILFYNKDPSFDNEVEKFRQLIIELGKNNDDIKLLETLYKDNKLACEKLGHIFPDLPVHIWIKHIKTTGPMKTYIPYNFNASDVTKKVLKNRMKHIQISQIEDINNKEKLFSTMTAKTFKLAWSINNRDIDLNLENISESSYEAITSEINNFLIQVNRYESYYHILKNTIKYINNNIQNYNSVLDNETLIKYIKKVGNERNIKEQYLNWIIYQIIQSKYEEEPSLDTIVTNIDIQKGIENIIDDKNIFQLSVICEEMRSGIKRYQLKCKVAVILLKQIINPSEDYNIPPLEKRVLYAAFRAFSWIPMYEVNDEIKREVLIDTKLSHLSRNIILYERFGARTTYWLEESEERIIKLNELTKIGRAEKEHAKYIRPIIRKIFDKDVDVYLHFKSKINEKNNVIPLIVELYANVSENEADTSLQKMKKLGFSITDSRYPKAYLEIDISHLKGDKKRIKEFIKNMLTTTEI